MFHLVCYFVGNTIHDRVTVLHKRKRDKPKRFVPLSFIVYILKYNIMSFYLASLFCRLQTFVFALLFYGIFLLVDDVNTSCQAVKCIVCFYV